MFRPHTFKKGLLWLKKKKKRKSRRKNIRKDELKKGRMQRVQILKRAKNAEMEIISAAESESNVRDEVNRRTHKAGLTDRDGQMKTGCGKGDTIRPYDRKKYAENYEKIFRKEK